MPKPQYLDALNKFIAATCAHRWVIKSSNGLMNEGDCQRVSEVREFSEAVDTLPWPISHLNRAEQQIT